MSWRLALSLVVLLLVALFAAQNSSNVVITFLNRQAEAPLSIVILGTFATGIIVVGFTSSWRQFLLNRRIRLQQEQIAQLEKELHVLRKLDAEHEANEEHELPITSDRHESSSLN